MRGKYSREELLKIGKEVGHLTSDEWVKRKDLPSTGPINRIFGNWRNFRLALLEEEKGKEEAERIKATLGERSQRPLYSREDLLRYAVSVWPVNSDEWSHRKDLPSIGPINRLFGNWTNFKHEVETYIANPYAANLGEPLYEKKKRIPQDERVYQKRGFLRKRIEDPVLKSKLEETVNEFIASREFNQDRHAIYHITKKARERLGSDSVTVSAVREQVRSSSKELFSSWNHRVYTTLENFLTVENYLKNRKLKELERYGHPAGVYFLVSDLRNQGITINTESLNCFIEDKKALEDLIGEKTSKVKKWGPRPIYLTFEQADVIVKTLKDIYEIGSDFFFERYGSSLGVLDLATDIEENGYTEFKDVDWREIHSLIGDGEVVSAILDIDDPRFETDWKPRIMYLNGRKADIIIPHLGKRYEQNQDAFFKIYGSELGAVILAKELQQLHHLSISPSRLTSFISDGRDMEKILGVEDKRFRGEWRPRTIQVPLGHLETITMFLKEQYEKDSTTFFTKYSSELGAIALSEDLEKEKKVKVNPSVLQRIVGKGNLVEILLDIKDERFSSWNQCKVAREMSLINSIQAIMKEAYSESKNNFLERYGCAEGAYHLAKDLRDNAGHTKRININEICDMIGTYSKIKQLTDIDDATLENSWNPRRFNLYLDTFESILGVLKKEYEKDSDKFFRNYGGSIGTYKLAKKLNQEGVKITHLTNLGTIVNKGEVFARLLGIEDERFKQPECWKPRAIQVRMQDLEKILDFVRDKYNEDEDEFFKRYGAKEGQVNLGRDLEQALKKKVGYLNSIVGDGQALSELLEINDPRFATDWNARVVMNANQDRIELVLNLLKEKYQHDSESFFSVYGRKSGIIDVARDLHKEKRIDAQLSNITTLVQDGEKLAASLGIKDKRFTTEWKPKQVYGKFSDVEATLIYLKKKFVVDYEEFLRCYGSTDGIVSLLSEMEQQNRGITNPAYLSELLNKEILAEQLSINIEQFDVDFKPKRTSFNNKSLGKVLEKLKQQYNTDSDLFFDVYGSRLGAMILAEELNLPFGARSEVNNFLSRRTDFEGLLGNEDERFKLRWLSKLSPELEKIAIKGIQYLAEGRKLPEIDEPITEDLKEYLIFRNNVLRGLSTGFANQGLASVYKSANKETVLHFAKVFAPKLANQIEGFVDSSIEEDRKILNETTLESIAGSGRLYTKEKLIEIGKKAGITTSTEWQKTSGLPSYVTIYKHFGGWGEFQEAISNSDVTTKSKSDKITNSKSLSTDEYSLRAGRLLYSFDPKIRLKATGLLLDFGTRSHIYQESKNKTRDISSVANELLEASIVRYDPYKLFAYDQNKLLPLLKWVSGYVKHAEKVLEQKNGVNVSIERGGYESEKLHGGNRGIMELA